MVFIIRIIKRKSIGGTSPPLLFNLPTMTIGDVLNSSVIKKSEIKSQSA